MSDGYNGWGNYETWVCALWLDNDGVQDEYIEGIRETWETETHITDTDDLIDGIAQSLENLVTDLNPIADSGASLYTDLLTSALQSIDFTEIAAAWIEDADLEPREQDEEE